VASICDVYAGASAPSSVVKILGGLRQPNKNTKLKRRGSRSILGVDNRPPLAPLVAALTHPRFHYLFRRVRNCSRAPAPFLPVTKD